MEDMIYAVAAMVPLVGGIYVGRSKGRTMGIIAGVGLFVALVLLLVLLGFGY